jgi:hypothetical protein
MKRFNKILSEISGYTVKELTDRNTEPLIQPFDCLLAMQRVKNNDTLPIVRRKNFRHGKFNLRTYMFCYWM